MESRSICQILKGNKGKKSKSSVSSFIQPNRRSERIKLLKSRPVYLEHLDTNEKKWSNHVKPCIEEKNQVTDNEYKSSKYKCLQCPALFAFKSSLKKHISSNHEVKKFVCDICKATFLRKDSINRHKNLVHFDKKATFQCIRCNMIFNYKPNHVRHIKSCH